MKSRTIAAMALTAASLHAQVAGVSRVEGQSLEYAVEMSAGPQWRSWLSGKSVARLQVSIPGAAACQFEFHHLALRPGEELFIHAAGSPLGAASHGPYSGNGPLNLPSFDSKWLPGSEFVMEILGEPSANWPFLMERIRCLTSAELDDALTNGLQILPRHVPRTPRQAGVQRTGLLDGEQVIYRVVDGERIYQGDIIIPEDVASPSSKSGERAAFGITDRSRRWPGFKVPYEIDMSLISSWQKNKIDIALATWQTLFPGLLVPRTNESDYVVIRHYWDVCQSSIGRAGGKQYINLDEDCSTGAIRHEIGHAIGLFHEHQRLDRDNYVKIHTENILAGYENDFAIPSASISQNLGAYDYGSLMHYFPHTFSSNGEVVIEALQPLPAGVKMGGTGVPSSGDIAGVKSLMCKWLSIPTSKTIDYEGGTFTLSFTLPSQCGWTATDSASWITVLNTAGTGSGTITYKVAPNLWALPRTATISVNGAPMSVTQIKFGE